MPEITQLQIHPVLQVRSASSCRAAELSTEDYTPLIIKSVARLYIHRIGALKILYFACIDPCDDLMLGVTEHFVCIYLIILRTRAHAHEGQQVPNLIALQTRNHLQFV